MEKVKKLFGKYKFFLSDMFLNMVGFGIYIVSQQILLLPILAKIVEDEVYSSFVLFLSILNVVCNVVGGELGNTRLVKDSDYKEKNTMGDFSRIFLVASLIVSIILLPILIYLKYSVIACFILILTIILANVRLYSLCYYRLQKQYKKVIIQNTLYLLGIIISLTVFYFWRIVYLLLIIPEILCTTYAFFNSDIFKMKLKKTTEMKLTVKKFSELGVVSFLTNMMSYFDKFIIYPMFGATAVAAYYAVNSMSKITSLITNPMSSVILSWVSNTDGKKDKSRIMRMTLIANIPAILGVTIVTIPCTYIALRILYSQYLAQALVLIIPISVASGFGTANSLLKSVLLKYMDSRKLLVLYSLYFVIFGISSYFLVKAFELTGFAFANLISQVILWGMLIIGGFATRGHPSLVPLLKHGDIY